MKFVSYAQNYEDVMLWRALKHVERGFYIDIGANDPDIDSVTKAFYERGWSGINVEPLPTHHADLMHARPRDINLQCAVGEACGEMELWEYDVRGWATAAVDVLEQHQRDGRKGRVHRVQVATLSDICKTHVDGEIHFLKVDVEGFEKSVLAGADFNKYRPWILVIEATKPNSTEEAFEDWEPLLITSGYQFCFFDGLNRYYVARERSDLIGSFRSPACVFDNFVSQEQRQLEISLQQALAITQRAMDRAAHAEANSMHAIAAEKQQQLYLQHLVTKLTQAELAAAASAARLQEVTNSKIWRLTAPLRTMGTVLKRLLKATILPILLSLMSFVLSRPALRNRGSQLVKKFPYWAHRIHLIAIHRGLVEAPSDTDSSLANINRSTSIPPSSKLSLQAGRIRQDLMQAAGSSDK